MRERLLVREGDLVEALGSLREARHAPSPEAREALLDQAIAGLRRAIEEARDHDEKQTKETTDG